MKRSGIAPRTDTTTTERGYEKMKGAKRVINAICSVELQNLDDKEFSEGLDDYLIVDKKTGFFWGKMAKNKLDKMKRQVKIIST